MAFSRLIALGAALMWLLSGCATLSDADPSKWSDARIYKEAQDALKSHDYLTAIKQLEDLQVKYPFSDYTKQGQLDIAYAYYKYDEPDSAISAADQFIKLYPRDEKVAYAYYLKGLVNFERGVTALDRFLDLDKTKRDIEPALEAYNSFDGLIKRFPNSRYVEDARQRMIALRNRIARYELHVADYYMRRGAYLAAAKRAQMVLEEYPRTEATPDALAIMVKAYRQLNLTDLADDALKVLKLNYPDHPIIDKLTPHVANGPDFN